MGKFIKFLLVCLGFKSLTACEVFYGTDEYGTPYSVAVTDAEGRFHVIHGTFPFRDNTFDIQFTDIDGEAGGGLFEEQTVTVQAEMVEEGDGWDEGDYAVKEDVNVVLERQ